MLNYIVHPAWFLPTFCLCHQLYTKFSFLQSIC